MKALDLPNGKTFNLYTPKELKEHLDKYVVGQEKAKRTICTGIYNHYKRLYLNLTKKYSTKIDKSNIFLVGATGSGKTFIIKTIAEFMGVPYYIADATSITQAGYVGDDVETVLTGLLRASDYNTELAEMGIVFIDEIDKLAKRNSGPNLSGKDPVGEGVQQALLKIVEGNTIGVPPTGGRKHPEQELAYVNTENILFVGSGSFAGIEDIIKDRLKGESKIGFSSNKESNYAGDDIMNYLCQEDMRKFGFIPEFVGRFPVITNVNPLSKEDLIKIITEPKNNILDQYAALLAVDDIKFKVTKEAIEEIANVAVKLKTGARSIRSIFECIMEDYMFETPGTDTTVIEITSSYVKEKTSERYKNIKNNEN